MKIALLSFHNAINFGAALQAYALQRALSLADYDCEYINYQNKSRQNAYNMSHHIMKNVAKGKFSDAIKYLLGSPFMYIRKWRFNEFYNNYLTWTKTLYTSSLEANTLNGKYDKFIVGSDQVWNYKNNGSDFAFLLDFVSDNEKKISYSSSFGIASIPKELEDNYRKNLQSIKHLAVREKYGVSLIKKIAGREAKLVLDPVFLLTKDEWLSLLPKTSIINKESYIFSYTNRKGQLESFFSQTNYHLGKRKIYKLSRHLTPNDFIASSVRQKYTMSPVDFIQTINNADLIVSASFHCIALSIVLNKPFVAILTGDKGKDERITSLLEIINLQDRILHDSMTEEEVYQNINYDRVNAVIKKLKKDSLDYLNNSINS